MSREIDLKVARADGSVIHEQQELPLYSTDMNVAVGLLAEMDMWTRELYSIDGIQVASIDLGRLGSIKDPLWGICWTSYLDGGERYKEEFGGWVSESESPAMAICLAYLKLKEES